MADSKQQIAQGQPQGFCPNICPGCGNKCQVESLAISAFNNVTPICKTCWDYEVSFSKKASNMWKDKAQKKKKFETYIKIILAYFDTEKRKHIEQEFERIEKED